MNVFTNEVWKQPLKNGSYLFYRNKMVSPIKKDMGRCLGAQDFCLTNSSKTHPSHYGFYLISIYTARGGKPHLTNPPTLKFSGLFKLAALCLLFPSRKYDKLALGLGFYVVVDRYICEIIGLVALCRVWR